LGHSKSALKKCRFIATDPGISGTGFAVFKERKLVKHGNLYSKKSNWIDKSFDLSIQLEHIYEEENCEKIFIEWPSNFTGSKKGQAAINMNSINKLACFIGMVLQRIPNGYLIPVQIWKGQVPKQVTQYRVDQKYPYRGIKNHATDAVGLGMFVLGKKLHVQ